MRLEWRKKSAGILAMVMFLLTSSCLELNTDKFEITVNLPDGRMEMLAPSLRTYLYAEFDTSLDIAYLNMDYDADIQTSWLTFHGGNCESYIVRYSTEGNMSPCVERRVLAKYGGGEIYFGTLLPDTTYYIQVVAEDDKRVCSKIVDFTTEHCTTRVMRILDENGNGPRNVRDIGGYINSVGKTVKYGMVYRGTYLNKRFGEKDVYALTNTTRAIMKNELGIRSEIDLRTSGVDDINMTAENSIPQMKNMLDDGLPYYKYSVKKIYDRIFSSKETLKNIASFFHTMAEETNYPVYVHCNAGADRTGTVITLLLGLLGVSYKDIVRDFEITNFSPQGRYGKWLRTEESGSDDTTYVAWGRFYDNVMAYGEKGCTFQEAVECFLEKIGVKEVEMEEIKRILIR